MGNINRPFVTIITPCYNEEAILQNNINVITTYLESKIYKFSWEVLIIDDGSKDRTGEIADLLAGQTEVISGLFITPLI